MAPCKDRPAGKPAQEPGVNQLNAVTSRTVDALAEASRQARRSRAAKVDAPLPPYSSAVNSRHSDDD